MGLFNKIKNMFKSKEEEIVDLNNSSNDGDEEVEELKKNDGPIVIDERIFDKLSTYTSEDLP